MTECEEAARRWDEQAAKLKEWATYQRGRSEHAGATDAKIALCEAAAESLRLEDRTGVHYCACCLRPDPEEGYPER